VRGVPYSLFSRNRLTLSFLLFISFFFYLFGSRSGVAGVRVIDTAFGKTELVLHERPPASSGPKREGQRDDRVVVAAGPNPFTIVALSFSPFGDLLVFPLSFL
jgi:hypothetical protein